MAASVEGAFVLIDRASGPLRRIEEQAKRTDRAMSTLGDRMDNVGTNNQIKQYEKVGKSLRDVERQAKPTTQGMQSLEKQVEKTDNAMNGFNRSGGRMARTLPLLAGAVALLLPIIIDLSGALGALIGSLGAATLGVGALGTAMGGMFLVALGGVVGTALAAKKQIAGLKDEAKELGALWREQTKPGQAHFMGMLTDTMERAKGLIPMVAESANRSTKDMARFVDTFLNRLEEGNKLERFLDRMNDAWRDSAVPLGDALANIGETLVNIARQATPFVDDFVRGIRDWTAGWVEATSNSGQMRRNIAGWIDQAKSWKDLLGATWDLTLSVFGSGKEEGQGLVDDMTSKLRKWNNWVLGNEDKMNSFWGESIEGTKELFRMLGSFRLPLKNLNDAMEPLVSLIERVVTSLNQEISTTGISAMTGVLGLYLGKKGYDKVDQMLFGGRGSSPARPLFVRDTMRSPGGGRGGGGGVVTGGRGREGDRDGRGGTRSRIGKVGAIGGIFTALMAIPELFGDQSSSIPGSAGGRRGITERATDAWGRLDPLSWLGIGVNDKGQGLMRQGMQPLLELGGPGLSGSAMEFVTPALEKRAGELGVDPSFIGQDRTRRQIKDMRWPAGMESGEALEGDALKFFNAQVNRIIRGALRRGGWKAMSGDGDLSGVAPGALGQLPASNRRLQPVAGLSSLGALLRSLNLGPAARDARQSGRATAMRETTGAQTGLPGRQELPQHKGIGGLMEKLPKIEVDNKVGPKVKQAMDAIAQNTNKINGAIKKNTDKDWRQTRRSMVEEMQKAQPQLRNAMQRIRAMTQAELKKMGYSGKEVSTMMDFAGSASSEGGKNGGNTAGGGKKNATGGRLAGGGRLGGIGTQDKLALGGNNIAAPGELVVNRHTEARVNRDLMHAGKAPLGAQVARENRPHYMQPPASQRSSPAQRRRHAGGGRLIPAAGFPGETWNSRIAGAATRLMNRFNLFLTDAYGPGHQSPEHTQIGTALDVVPGPGGSWGQVDQAVAYAVQQGFTPVYYDGRFGSINLPPHGPGHHAHITMMTASEYGSGATIKAGGLGAAMGPTAKIKLKAPRTGMKGLPGAMAQGGMNIITRATEAGVNKKLGNGARGVPGNIQAYNKMWPKGSPDTIPFNAAAMIAEAAGLPGVTFAQVAIGESSLRPGAVGDDAAAGYGNTWGHGLWQITSGVGNDALIQRFGGIDAMYNPVINARAAKAIYEARGGGGSGLSAWYGSQHVTDPNAHWTGGGGRKATGGRVDFGGWFGEGGRFHVERPTLIGVGDRAEDVQITPRGKTFKGASGNKTFNVTIGDIHVGGKGQRGDIKRAVKAEVGAAFDELAEEMENS